MPSVGKYLSNYLRMWQNRFPGIDYVASFMLKFETGLKNS